MEHLSVKQRALTFLPVSFGHFSSEKEKSFSSFFETNPIFPIAPAFPKFDAHFLLTVFL